MLVVDNPKYYAPIMGGACSMCGTGAIMRFRGAFVCYGCYMKLIQTDADRFCNERGLDTTEKKIEFCRSLMRKFVQRQRATREPGSDDA